MARKCFCDKCEREVNINDLTTLFVLREFELCSRCLERLREWLKPDPKAMESAR